MKKWAVIIALIAGGGVGAAGIANLIDIFKPYIVLITTGGTFLGVVAAFFVAKANKPEEIPK